MKKILLAMLFVLVPVLCFGFVATVNFDAPTNPAYCTVILVSEVSGDYSESFGQRSDPGATEVLIGNIKPSTTYYFSGYRLDTATWEQTPMADEITATSAAYAEPIVYDLPPTPLSGDKELNITITIN